MTIVKEFRIPMPLSVKDYRRGQRYSVARTNNEATKGKDGVELVEAKPWTDPETGITGYYTRKIYHLDGYLPGWVRAIIPGSATKLYEESWDAFPKSKTILTSPFLGSKLTFQIESNHLEGDKGEAENAVGLSDDVLKVRQVRLLDIATDKLTDKAAAADPSTDPTKFKGKHFGPLSATWLADTPAKDCMCAYKVVTLKVAQWGVQTKAENWLAGTEEQIFLKFHKQLLCWMDEWFDLSLEELLAREAQIYDEMNAALAKEGALEGGGAKSAATAASESTAVEAEEEEKEGKEEKKKKKNKKHGHHHAKGSRSGHHGGKKHRKHKSEESNSTETAMATTAVAAEGSESVSDQEDASESASDD